MAYGKRFDEWDRAGIVMALIYNDPMGNRPYRSPESFTPFASDLAPALVLNNPEDIAPLIGGTLGKVK